MKKNVILILLVFSVFTLNAQDKNNDKAFNYNPDNYDLMGLFAKKGATPKVDTNWSKTKWSIFPAIAINLAIGTGYGFGFRMKLNKESRSNFALDFGWNEEGYAGFYMQLNETF